MSQQDESITHLMNRLATIKITTFKAVTGLFFALSFLSVLGRIGIRIHARKLPSADDYLVFFGLASLIAGSGVLWSNLNNLYLIQVLYVDPSIAYRVKSNDLLTAMSHFMARQVTGLALLWTATFAVKFSFLAFFWQLVEAVDNIRKYYWFVVVATFVSWLFVIAEPFILCHKFGMESVQCSYSYSDTLYFSMTGLVTALDCLTDLMIVSIPILVLRQSTMKLRQKAAIGSFLCLSIIMIALAITRASKMAGVVATDIPYEMFFQYLEAAVALLTASLTAFRTFFVTQRERTRYQDRMKKPSFSFRNIGLRKKTYDISRDEEANGLPEVPGATMTGVRSFIRRNNRTEGNDTIMKSFSPQSTLISEECEGFVVRSISSSLVS
ncbi:hypothetical protein DM02DRAFT_611901 [Periconia macrospinosa]|uniref:Rhodopsin domain-containing protein n=1 Tax=Periconia macrospinosa TaxID=97972 RepID=A0A2V1E0L8_9PLEO|nr:hypothetical protein DM02DRAFT_611901 [Periconia macrospinosa]